jgi:acyl carrier protein
VDGIMGTKGYTYFGAERRPIAIKKSHRKTFTERLREIVAEAMGVDEEEITDSYPIKKETELMPNGLLDLIEIAMVIEKEYELGEVFSEDNEQVFDSFGTLLEFVKDSK